MGNATPELRVPSAALVMGERRLLGSAVYTRADFEATVRWLDDGADLAPMIEARVDLHGLAGAFAGYADGSLTAMKTLWTTEPAPI